MNVARPLYTAERFSGVLRPAGSTAKNPNPKEGQGGRDNEQAVKAPQGEHTQRTQTPGHSAQLPVG